MVIEEFVVLVDEQNNVLGTEPKDKVHSKNTPLHRGFSLFLFNSKKELLVTKRAKTKKTFPGMWSNTACGHPAPGESAIDAAKRRLRDELGIGGAHIKEVAPYRYRFADTNGIVENEICPVLVGHYDGDPTPDPKEVEEWKWMKWEDFLEDIKKNKAIYSPWCIEEAQLINSHVPA